MNNVFDEIFQLNEALWLATKNIHVPIYDFNFRQFFNCKTPYQIQQDSPVIARIGAIQDYNLLVDELAHIGLSLINSKAAHELCSELSLWYPILSDLTPKSKVYDTYPDIETIEQVFFISLFYERVASNQQTPKKTFHHHIRISLL